MRKLIILILLLLVLGLYFYTAQTKEVISSAATLGTDIGGKVVDKGIDAAEEKISDIVSNEEETGN